MYYQVKIAVYKAKTLTVCFKNTVRPISREKLVTTKDILTESKSQSYKGCQIRTLSDTHQMYK